MAGILLPGDAIPANVLINKKFSAGSYYDTPGSMVDRGAPTIVPGANSQNLGVGCYSGGVVKAALVSGTTVTDQNLVQLNQGKGSVVWSKDDIGPGRSVITDSSGNVYVGTTLGVYKFNSSGTLLWSNLEAVQAWGIVVDNSGNVYVACKRPSGKTVFKLDNLGQEVWSNSEVINAQCITLDSLGNVYVGYGGGAGTKVLRKFYNSGTEVWSSTEIGSVTCVKTDAENNVYVGYYVTTTTVRKLNSSGIQQWAFTDAEYTRGIALDPDGNLYVAFYRSTAYYGLYKINGSTGVEIAKWSQFPYPYGIAVDAVNNIYLVCLADSGNITHRLNNAGKQIWVLTDIKRGSAIHVDSNGKVYVCYDNSTGIQFRKLDGAFYYTII